MDNLMMRRRAMMALLSSGGGGGYPDPFVDDGKVWVYCDVDTITENFTLGYGYLNSNFSSMEIDGVEMPIANSYRFSTLGEHLVKFTPVANCKLANAWKSTWGRPKRVYLPSTIHTLSGTFYDCSTLEGIYNTGYIARIEGQTFCFNGNWVQPVSFPALASVGNNFIDWLFGDIADLGVLTTLPTSFTSGVAGLNAQCTSAVLPATLTSIGDNVFKSVYNLKNVTCLAVNPPTLGSGFCQYVTLESIKVPAGAVNAYKTAPGWSDFASIITAI